MVYDLFQIIKLFLWEHIAVLVKGGKKKDLRFVNAFTTFTSIAIGETRKAQEIVLIGY